MCLGVLLLWLGPCTIKQSAAVEVEGTLQEGDCSRQGSLQVLNIRRSRPNAIADVLQLQHNQGVNGHPLQRSYLTS